MKRPTLLFRPFILTLLVIGMTVFFAQALLAQDTVAKKPQKVIRLKVDTDENGESVKIDTTFVIDDDDAMEAFNEAMKEYEIQMKEMDGALREMEIELKGEEMEKALQEAHLALRDVYREMPRVRSHARGVGSPRHHNVYWSPDRHEEMFVMKPPKRGESLSDVLGDIPMSAVKSYRIKETKDGKRITIEVSDDALFDRDEDIIIWHDAGSVPPPPRPPKIKREVIIDQKVDSEKPAE